MAAKKIKNKNVIFAAVGAATGLGNAFRFPALCVSYGAAFILAYAVMLGAVCFPLLCAEMYLGINGAGKRRRQWAFILRVAAANSALIGLYYGVIATKLCSASLCSMLPFNVISEDWSTVSGTWTFIGAWALVILCVFFILRRAKQILPVTGKISVTLSLTVFSVLAVLGVCAIARGGVAFSFDFSALARCSTWADALGQALLSLSLAGGVMPSFARTGAQCSDKKYKIVPTALAITLANLAGCILAFLATLPFVKVFPEQGGVNAGMQVYAQVIAAVAPNAVWAKVAGAFIFGTLTVVAVHSLCSLANPSVSFYAQNGKPSAVIFALACALLLPFFMWGGCEMLSACDRMACTVCAVCIAFSECLIFTLRGNIKGVIANLVRFLCLPACGALALFSLCSARFGCFSPIAQGVAYAVLAAVLCCGLLGYKKTIDKSDKSIYT
ncbi:MAG: hypothetical protein K2N14_04085 [Clostridia bacterium]|nr:hypothetical protein [Clostridia bacterium]